MKSSEIEVLFFICEFFKINSFITNFHLLGGTGYVHMRVNLNCFLWRGGVCLLAPRGEGKKGEGRSPLLLPSVVYGLSGLDVYPAAGRFSVLCGCTESVL